MSIPFTSVLAKLRVTRQGHPAETVQTAVKLPEAALMQCISVYHVPLLFSAKPDL